MRASPWNALYAFFHDNTGPSEAFQGTGTLATAPNGPIDKGNWTLTFDQEFTDINAAIVDSNDASAHVANRFYSKGRYDTAGAAGTYAQKSQTFTSIEGGTRSLYRQGGASTAKLGIGQFSSQPTKAYGSNIETLRKRLDKNYKDAHTQDITEGFSQQYGYFECRFACPPTFRTDAMIAWPAFWLYSDIWNHPFEPGIELDVCELYRSCTNGSTEADGFGENDPSHHVAWHYHDSMRTFSYPGFIGKDIGSTTQIFNPKTHLSGAWGGSAFNFADMHTYGIVLGPRWVIIYMDGIEVNRLPAIDELHQRFYMLVSHQINGQLDPTQKVIGLPYYQKTATSASPSTRTTNTADPLIIKDGGGNPVPTSPALYTGGFVTDSVVDMEVDYVKAWQNPDWNNRTIGGTADAKTVTTILSAPSFATLDGRAVNGTSTTANTTTTPTLNANGLGAKVIKKHSDFANLPPWTGALIPLAAGDIVANARHMYEYNLAGDCWILLNPGRSWANSPKFTQPTLGMSLQQMDRKAVEAALAAKFGHASAMPPDHPAQALGFNPDTLISPRTKPNTTLNTVQTRPAGYVIGKVQLSNTPAVPGRWTLEANSYFDIEPATGNIVVKAGATLAVGSFTYAASCWSPGVPTPKGSNVCLVTIAVSADIDFDMTFFGANLQLEIDPGDAATVFTDTTRTTLATTGQKVAGITDKSPTKWHGTQSTDANRPTYNTTGLNGRPALISTGSAINLQLPTILPGWTANQFNGITLTADASTIGLHNVTVTSEPFDNSIPLVLYWEWTSSGEVKCFVNGTDMGVKPYVPTNILSNGWAVAVVDRTTTGSTVGVFGQNDTGISRVMSTAGGTGFVGAYGYLAIGKNPQTQAGRDKVIGFAAHHLGLQASLPTGHPYKTTPPKMFS